MAFAMPSPLRPRAFLFPCVLFMLLLPIRSEALRVVDYNLLNYPGTTGTSRAPYYRTVLAPLHPDIIVVEEIASATGPTQFLNEVLNVLEPGAWATVPFIDGNDTDASLFYKTEKVEFLGQGAFYPNPSNHLRYVHTYRLRPSGYFAAEAELRVFTAHLKASTGYEDQRLAECTGIRDSLNALPAGTRALLCGDMNFYNAGSEPGYSKLLESQSNDIGRVYDLLPAGSWHDNATYASYHTQSTCLSGACASGAATGGMDDRFDFILPTYSLAGGNGLATIRNTCFAVGNDGQHLNKNITDSPTIPEGAEYATALKMTSDHLPLRVDLQLPAKIEVASSLIFDPVIIGAPTQSSVLLVSNPAIPPADSLNCIFAPPPGFGSPSSLVVPAAATMAASITMGASDPGSRTGSLLISSDAPDTPTNSVLVSGVVLRHAVASFDSANVAQTALVDFGDHEAGAFPSHAIRLFNLGYDALQARLLLSSATIDGGSGRFSFAGGFECTLVGEAPRVCDLLFDGSGADADSTYIAQIVFTSSDEPLAGAIGLPDMVVTLRAHVNGSQAGLNDINLPVCSRVYPPYPNPIVGETRISMDLARAGLVSVSVYDASGRRVAAIHEGTLGVGRHVLSWDGRTDRRLHVSSGVYFIRFNAPGMRSQSIPLVIAR
jgi:hypothetical protein